MYFLTAVRGAEIIGRLEKYPYVAVLMAGVWWLLRLIKCKELHYSAEINTKLLGSPEGRSKAISMSELEGSTGLSPSPRPWQLPQGRASNLDGHHTRQEDLSLYRCLFLTC